MYKFAIMILLLGVVGGIGYYFTQATDNHKDAYVGASVAMADRRSVPGTYVLQAEKKSSVYVISKIVIKADGTAVVDVTSRQGEKSTVQATWLRDGDEFFLLSFMVPGTGMATDISFMKDPSNGVIQTATFDQAYFGNDGLVFAMVSK